MITQQKKNIDIVAVIESAGWQLTARSGRHVGLCLFHDDHSPSFYVYEDHFHCYGCHAHGDVIDFTMRLHGCDFNEACRLLGLKKGPVNKAQIIELKRKRLERERYQQRESDLAHTLALLIRTTQRVINTIKTIEDLEEYADLLHSLPFWKHCHHILSQGDPDERHHVVDGLKEMVTLKRNRLFEPDFNFSKWLRETFKKEPTIERKRKTGTARF